MTQSAAETTPVTGGLSSRIFSPQSRVAWYRLLFTLVWLATWQFASGRLVDPFWVSSPSAIAYTFWNWLWSGLLLRHLAVTFQETAIGFLFGSLLGVVLGVLIGQSETVRRTFDPFLTAFYGVPKIALAPLFIMWFGIGMMPKIVLAAVSVFFLVLFNTLGGVREVDSKLINAMKVMGASRFQILAKVVLPASLPWIMLGLKLGLPYGFIGAVAAEMMASNEGIGFLTQSSAGQFDTAGVFCALVALMLVTTLMNEVLGLIEDRLFRWR
jgi:NitT/TauT family transport system permease protein